MERKELIKSRIKNLFAVSCFEDVCKFVALYCNDFNAPSNISINTYFDALSEFIYNAPKEAKEDFLNRLDVYGDSGLRVCSVCGKFMVEGYITANFEYYCSDECRLKGYMKETNGDEKRAQEMIDADFTDDSEDFFYTEW